LTHPHLTTTAIHPLSLHDALPIFDIGAGTTDFCVMRGRYPAEEDQRTLTTAGDSIDQHLLKVIQERYPQANVTIFMVREWKEKRSEEHTSELQSLRHLVCRLLLEK